MTPARKEAPDETKDFHPQRLPPGRHGMARPEVEEYQRRRLLEAMVITAAQKGYPNTVVADVLQGAGVSRATFYALFDDKLECLLAAHDMVMESLAVAVADACAAFADETWAERMRRGLEALLARLNESPEWARFILIEVSSAGPEARRRHRSSLQYFMRYLEDGFEVSGLGSALPPQTPRMAVTSAAAMLLDEVLANQGDRLPEQMPDVLFAILVPFIGPAAASEEIARSGVSN